MRSLSMSGTLRFATSDTRRGLVGCIRRSCIGSPPRRDGGYAWQMSELIIANGMTRFA
jgi:hypothetical protein